MKTRIPLPASVLVVWLLSLADASAFYDPGLQRWINRDPIEEEGGLNLYEFVANGPLNLVDANGLEWVRIYDENYNKPVFGRDGPGPAFVEVWVESLDDYSRAGEMFHPETTKLINMAMGMCGGRGLGKKVPNVVKESVEEAAKKKKHTPGRDHQTKSKEKKTERFQKKAAEKRAQEKKDLEDAWDKWNKMSEEAKKILKLSPPNKPDPRCP